MNDEITIKALRQERDKYLRDRDELDTIVIQKNEQIKQLKAQLAVMTERVVAVGKVAEAGRKLWQEYAILADDLPDDMRGDFKRCSYLAGRFADALGKLEANREEENQ